MEPRTLWQSARASAAVPASATHSSSASCVYLVMTKLLLFPTLSLPAPMRRPWRQSALYSDRRRSRDGAISRRKGEGHIYNPTGAARCIGTEARVNQFQATSARFSERG